MVTFVPCHPDCDYCHRTTADGTPITPPGWATPEARTFGDLTDDEVRDAVLTERLDWEAEQEAASPAAPESA